MASYASPSVDGSAALGGPAAVPAWIAPRHRTRTTAAQEIACIYTIGKASARVFAQWREFVRRGYRPRKGSLIEGEWHLRDGTALEAVRLGEHWYEEFMRWRSAHQRDQISFDYVAWRLGMLPPAANTSCNTTKRRVYQFADDAAVELAHSLKWSHHLSGSGVGSRPFQVQSHPRAHRRPGCPHACTTLDRRHPFRSVLSKEQHGARRFAAGGLLQPAA